jgi:anaerobic magnesium-protoporphyrin IX monomethyl ester cyclase
MSELSGKKSQILLVNVPFAEGAAPGAENCVPLGLMLVGTILRNAGYVVNIINGPTDPLYRQKYTESISKGCFLFIGFSVMSSQIGISYTMAKEAKAADPDAKIVWGGFHPTIYPGKTVSDDNIDIAVPGEAISVILPLARYLSGDESIEKVPGIYYKSAGNVKFNNPPLRAEFDQIPDIDWTLLERHELEKIINAPNTFGQTVRSLPLLTGLGCNFRCAFCHNSIFAVKYRVMDAERIIANMKFLVQAFEISAFVFHDENFFGDKKRFLAFLEQLERENLHIMFFSSMRASDLRSGYLTESVFKRLYDAGGRYFGVGAESGSRRMLEKLDKRITLEDIEDVVKMSLKTKVTFIFSFMIGIPGETIKDVYATLRLVRKIQKVNPKLGIIGPQVFRVYPGSKLYAEAVKSGLREPETLVGWTKVSFASHFRKVEKASLPWIDDFSLFEKIMTYYNVQSYNAYISGLQSIFYWNLVRKMLPVKMSAKVTDAAKRASDWAVRVIVSVSRIRLELGFMRCAVEYPLVSYLSREYFKNS